jgi:hypothetical protein
MKLKEFNFEKGNHFVAMEYYGLILNRTFVVLLNQNGLTGLKVNGLVSVQGGDPITFAITSLMSVNGDTSNPYSYIKASYLKKLENLDLTSREILDVSSCNFNLSSRDIEEVTFTTKKKWGMGPYPHDGRVFVKLRSGKKREFIILGNQSAEDITNWINKKTFANKT